ncbi:MAG: flippase-like domain-containing protein [Elainellaceae cyanobacterium]
MRRLSFIGLLIGFAILTALVIREGLDILDQILDEIGWQILWLPVFYTVPILCAIASWWWLFEPRKHPSFRFSTYSVWISFAINWLLPVGQVGGEIVRARMLIKRQFPKGEAIATVVGDQTLQVATQAVYTLVGFLLFAYTQLGDGTANLQLLLAVLIGIVIFAAASSLLYWLQHAGLFKLFARIAKRFPMVRADEPLEAGAAKIDAALKRMYRRRDRLLVAALWRLAFRVTAAGETWLAFYFLGRPITILDALILESIGQAIRSAAFFIPSGLGAQEGAIVLVGSALGIPSGVALASSLCKRVRELVIGIPGLIAWQLEEGKRALGP